MKKGLVRMKGIITAMVTASREDGSFDEKGMRALAENAVRTGMQGVFVFGSAGEFYAFTEEEKSYILDVVIDQIRGRIPVIAGCGAVTTRQAVGLCHMMQQKKIDYLSCITPYFVKPTQEELYYHYKAVASESDLPLILYHIPGRTGVRLEPETLERLKQIPNIAGIKDSSGDMDLFKQYMALDADDFQVMMGIDTLIPDALRSGATAAISAPSNAIGPILNGIYTHYRCGDQEKVQQLHTKVMVFKKLLQLAPAPTVVKAATNIIGIPVGPPKKPLTVPSDAICRTIEQVLRTEFAECFPAPNEIRRWTS